MIWLLLVIFQLKHFIADYPLQGSYMLGKFKDKGWVLPLATHCAVHWLFTTVIAFLVFFHAETVPRDFQSTKLYVRLLILAAIFGLIDFTIHFAMDRIKASPKMLGRFQALSKNDMYEIINQDKLGNNIEINNARKKSNVLFWWSLGLDQMVHHLTDILLIASIMAMI